MGGLMPCARNKLPVEYKRELIGLKKAILGITSRWALAFPKCGFITGQAFGFISPNVVCRSLSF